MVQLPGPTIKRSIELRCVGDWGQANFHRILSWLTQEFCDRAGPQSRTLIMSLRDGGMDSPMQVQRGEADIGICTPANMFLAAQSGEEIFAKTGPLSDLRVLAVLPQNDRMVFAIHPRFGINSFADIRERKVPLRIGVSVDDGTNFIGYVAARLLEAHGLDEHTVCSWGGSFVKACRPEQVLELVQSGQADAVVQEAIMTPWWRDLIESEILMPISAESAALAQLERRIGFKRAIVRADFWSTVDFDVQCLDFSDFLVLVSASLDEDVAFLLTWCLVETRKTLEAQYQHIPPERSPLSYPLYPMKMARSPLALHPAAERFYKENGWLA